MDALADEPWTCACSYIHDGAEAAAPECSMCGATCPVARYNVPIDMRNLLFASQQLQYQLVSRLDQVANVPLASAKEFSLCTTYHPRMIVEAIRNGVFPMSINIWEVDVAALKLHRARCIMAPPGVVHKATRKRASKFTVSLNTAFDDVANMIVAYHDRCWLCPALQRSLKHIMAHPQDYPDIRVLSWELWNADGQLVAGEVGYICGFIYTSMTGAYRKEFGGAGSVQLACTGAWLVKAGIRLWDFGMAMDYKNAMGGREVPRSEWVRTVSELGRTAVSATLLDDLTQRRTPCAELMPFCAKPARAAVVPPNEADIASADK